MKINELFGMLMSSGLNDCERTRVQNLVRRIIVGRGRLALVNDIACVFQARNEVAHHLGVPVPALDAIWKLSPVTAYLQASGLVQTVAKAKSDEPDDEGSDDDEDSDDADYVPETESDDASAVSFDESVVDDTPTLAAIQKIQEHLCGLRRQVFWIGGAAVLIHSISALVVMLVAPSANILPLPLHVYLQHRQVMASLRAMGNHVVALWHRYWP